MSQFYKVLAEMFELYDRKGNDYATEKDPHANFRVAADQVGTSVWQQAEALIATKQGRLRELYPWRTGKTPKNESVRDTLIDRAVYAVIAVCIYDDAVAEEQLQKAIEEN